MRFDDRLQTALKNLESDNVAAATQWRQLIDILARDPQNFPTEQVVQGLVRARGLIETTEKRIRVASIRSLPGAIKSPPLLQLLCSDDPAVGAAAVAKAELTDAQWAALIPDLPVRARGFMRNLNNLGPRARKALLMWAGADFVLPYNGESAAGDMSRQPSSEPEILELDEASAVPGRTREDDADEDVPISEIVKRIEKLRRSRETPGSLQYSMEVDSGGSDQGALKKASEIRFETDDLGVVCWVEGVPEGSIVGVSISQPAYKDEPGPDANGASAFRQRMPIEQARMRLLGSPIIEGDWRINAAPFFNPESGRFRGYRGILRRPNLAEDPQISEQKNIAGEQMQQLIHELRTPLGAIVGFSEIIEQQLFGPVAHDYRILAQSILQDARKLLAGFDDLSIASKVDSGQLQISDGSTDCNWLTARLADRLSSLSENLDVTLNLVTADPVRSFAIEQELAERIFSRLLSAIIIGCDHGEELDGRFHTEVGLAPVNNFTLTLPSKLAGLNEEELLGSDLGNIDHSSSAPLLGLGFSLRLVRNLARKAKGDLRFENEELLLTLPAVLDNDARSRNRER